MEGRATTPDPPPIPWDHCYIVQRIKAVGHPLGHRPNHTTLNEPAINTRATEKAKVRWVGHPRRAQLGLPSILKLYLCKMGGGRVWPLDLLHNVQISNQPTNGVFVNFAHLFHI